jgi:hypothetical protein
MGQPPPFGLAERIERATRRIGRPFKYAFKQTCKQNESCGPVLSRDRDGRAAILHLRVVGGRSIRQVKPLPLD